MTGPCVAPSIKYLRSRWSFPTSLAEKVQHTQCDRSHCKKDTTHLSRYAFSEVYFMTLSAAKDNRTYMFNT